MTHFTTSAKPGEEEEARPCSPNQSLKERHHGPLNLLVRHKHHDVPGPQTEIRRHESATDTSTVALKKLTYPDFSENVNDQSEDLK